MNIYLSRISLIVVGGVFVLSGLGKISDVFGFQQLIVDYGLNRFNYFAPFIILAEIFIGVCLIFNVYTKIIRVLGVVMLFVFTVAFTYAWRIHGITDCGCFGRYMPFRSSPLLVYLRNFTLLILLFISLKENGKIAETIKTWEIVTITTIMFSSVFLAGMSYRPFAFIEYQSPFIGKSVVQTPLSKYVVKCEKDSGLIMFFTYKCSHCTNSMENFSAWMRMGIVDNLCAVAVVDSLDERTDSLRCMFQSRFPIVKDVVEVDIRSVDFIDGFPCSYLFEGDTIREVIDGELCSPYVYVDSRRR